MQQNELNELLTKAKELLREETTQISYDTWIKDLEIESMENGNVVLLSSTSFNRDTVEARYHVLLVNTFNYLTNKECSVSILSKEEIQKNKADGISNNIIENNITRFL
ncbi:MAG: hypothetical protein GX682_06375 [Clostridiaceae bacterium]|nr:hypothetical protein [Clostridiaceae bacterium]